MLKAIHHITYSSVSKVLIITRHNRFLVYVCMLLSDYKIHLNINEILLVYHPSVVTIPPLEGL